MSAKVTLQGWTDLEAALAQLPEQLGGAAAAIVQDAGDETGRRLEAAYPPGELRDRVRVQFEQNRFGAISTVQSLSKWSEEWEFGTNDRATQQNWNRGAEPAHPDRGLLTIARDRRKRMTQRLADLVRGAGFTVSDEF